MKNNYYKKIKAINEKNQQASTSINNNNLSSNSLCQSNLSKDKNDYNKQGNQFKKISMLQNRKNSIERESKSNDYNRDDYIPPDLSSNINVEYLEKQLSEIEKTKKEVSRYLDTIKAERGNINLNNNSNWEISKLLQENQNLKSDNIIFREDINRLTELNQRLEDDLIRQRNRNLELANDIEMFFQEKSALKLELEREKETQVRVKTQEVNNTDLINIRYIQEHKIKDMESEMKNLILEKQRIEIDYRVTQERYTELKRTYEQESQENKFVRMKHNEEISSIEQKFDKMVKQIEQLTYENSNLRSQEEKLRIENMSNDKQKESFREKYQDYKNRYKIMSGKLADLESEFRSFIYQKEQETYEKRKDEEIKKKHVDSKQRILEDFQTKINSYKSQLYMNRSRRDEN